MTNSILNRPLPERWGRWQRYKNTIIYGIIRMTYGMFSILPISVLLWLAKVLGTLAPKLARADVKKAEQHCAIAFPDKSPQERTQLVKNMFIHLATSAMEVTHIATLLRGKNHITLPEDSRTVFTKALRQGKGVVAVTGHIGNWELLAQLVAKELKTQNSTLYSIAKSTYDPRLTRFVHQLRSQFGMGVIWRGDSGAAKEMLRVFKNNNVLALLIDQDTSVQSTFVPFFGQEASTPTAAAVFALRTGAPVVVGWIHRVNGIHQPHFEAVDFNPTGDKEQDIIALTALLTARLEYAIRQHPEQWVWLHRRWKTKAPAISPQN